MRSSDIDGYELAADVLGSFPYRIWVNNVSKEGQLPSYQAAIQSWIGGVAEPLFCIAGESWHSREEAVTRAHDIQQALISTLDKGQVNHQEQLMDSWTVNKDNHPHLESLRNALAQAYSQLRARYRDVCSMSPADTAQATSLVAQLERLQLAHKAAYGLLGNNPIE